MPTKQMNYVRIMDTFVGNVFSNTKLINFLGTKTGQSVPGYKSIIKNGGTASSPFAFDGYEVIKWVPLETSFRYHPNSNPTVKVTGSFRGFPAFVTPYPAAGVSNSILPTVTNKALINTYKKIRESRTGANGLLFMAEIKKTLHMLRNPAESVVKMVTQLCDSIAIKRFHIANNPRFKGKRLSAKEKRIRAEMLVKAAQGSWLEFSFGVKPLVSDISDIAETVYNKLTGAPPRTRARAYFEDSASQYISSITSVPSNNYPVSVNWMQDRRTKVGVQFVVGLKTDVVSNETSTFKTLAQDFGFTVENFVPTLYELVPFSFLLDYVSNLGKVIESVCTCTDNVTWVIKTTRTIDYNLNTVVPDRAINKANMVINDWTMEDFTTKPFVCELERRRMTREIPQGLEWPSLELTAKLADQPLKIVNCLALLGNLRSSQLRF